MAKYFVDFEATQFTNEIISIGCIREDGATFSSLVKPPKNKVTPFITALTGITKEMLAEADPIHMVMYRFLEWTKLTSDDTFYVYGSGDADFIDGTVKHNPDETINNVLNYIKEHMHDYHKDVCAFFGVESVGLERLTSYLRGEQIIQKHDALEDAEMLMEIFSIIPTLTKPTEPPEFPKSSRIRLSKKKKSTNIVAPTPPLVSQYSLDQVYAINIDNPAKRLDFLHYIDAAEYFVKGKSKTSKLNTKKQIRKALENGTVYRNYYFYYVKKGVQNG